MNKYINIHTHTKTNTDSFEIISSNNIDNNGYYSIGIHPWNIGDNYINYKTIEELAKLKNILAIGEIGLDRAIKTDINLQKEYFLAQLNIAKKNEEACYSSLCSCIFRFSTNYKTNSSHLYFSWF